MDRATWVAWACLVAAAGVGGCGSDLDDAVRRNPLADGRRHPPKEAGGVPGDWCGRSTPIERSDRSGASTAIRSAGRKT